MSREPYRGDIFRTAVFYENGLNVLSTPHTCLAGHQSAKADATARRSVAYLMRQPFIVRVPHAFNDADDADHATGASHPMQINELLKELNETSVFEWVGSEEGRKIWCQRPVHLLHQTKAYSVIANDGSIFPEAIIASKGATFLLNALNASRLKPKGDAGGGVVHGDHVH